MAAVGFELAPLVLVEQLVLIRVARLAGLADASTLGLQQLLQGRRLGLAALRQLLGDTLDLSSGALLQLRAQVGDILLGEQGDACGYRLGDGAGVPDRLFQLIERGVLAAIAEGLERLPGAVGLGPDGRDRNDLLVQARGAGAVERETAEEDHARLGALAADRHGAIQVGLKAVRLEAREQAPYQPVLQVDLHHVAGIGAVGKHRGLEGDGAHGIVAAPLGEALASGAAARAQIVEGIGPGRIVGEGGVIGVEAEGVDLPEAGGLGLVEVDADAGERRGIPPA